jgi:hypothetical protein
MTSSTAARARAQAAYGIASAIALGVVAGGLFAGLGARPTSVQIMAVAALAAWLIAAALFLYAVSAPFRVDVEPQKSDDEFVRAVISGVRQERTRIDLWQRLAQGASAAAALATVVAFVGVLQTERVSSRKQGTILITSTAARRLLPVCGRTPEVLAGRIAVDSLEEQFVDIVLAPGVCGAGGLEVTLRRSDVLAVAFQRTRLG